MPSFIERAAAKASEVELTKLLLSILAAPFYVLGWLIGLVVVVVLLAYGAVRLGIADVRALAERPSPTGEA
jgi:hypothetical protein